MSVNSIRSVLLLVSVRLFIKLQVCKRKWTKNGSKKFAIADFIQRHFKTETDRWRTSIAASRYTVADQLSLFTSTDTISIFSVLQYILVLSVFYFKYGKSDSTRIKNTTEDEPSIQRSVPMLMLMASHSLQKCIVIGLPLLHSVFSSGFVLSTCSVFLRF